MPRYFFDTRWDRQIYRDDIGVQCASDDDALGHAWSALPMLVSELDFKLGRQRSELTIRREDGASLARIGATLDFEEATPLAQAIVASKEDAKPLFE